MSHSNFETEPFALDTGVSVNRDTGIGMPDESHFVVEGDGTPTEIEDGREEMSSHKPQGNGVMSFAGVSFMGGILAAACLWSYWPTILELIDAWNTEPDYSHGYLVVPFAILFLWGRRDRYPGTLGRVSWLGLIPLALAIALRWIGGQWQFGAVDGWSMLFWVAGVVWLLAGSRLFWWALPSIVFLVFMVPMPWRCEQMLSVPLQRIATEASCWVLQFLGEPALASGNTIFLGQHKLEVAAACAGLRIFVGVLALAYAYVVLCRRNWWETAFLMLIAPLIAIFSNVTRIVVTGLLYRYASSEAAHKFFHDTAGWAMIVLAAALYGLVIWYLARLVREVETVDTAAVVRRRREPEV